MIHPTTLIVLLITVPISCTIYMATGGFTGVVVSWMLAAMFFGRVINE